MATVTPQQQGVPWGSKLRGPNAFRRQSTQPQVKNQYIRTREKTPQGSRTVTTHYAAPAPATSGQRSQRNPNLRKYNPANAGDTVSGSTGMLEGEFLLCLGLLVLLMFANTTSSYGEKVMSLMKRGTLICLLFFLLAIISNIGPNAEKVAKAFGGLIIVAILITTPINTVVTDVDSLIKNDWVGTSETGGDTAASADSGTSGGTSASGIESILNTVGPGPIANALQHISVSNIKSILNEVGPGPIANALQGVISKLHL
jgi:hypothetical protein